MLRDGAHRGGQGVHRHVGAGDEDHRVGQHRHALGALRVAGEQAHVDEQPHEGEPAHDAQPEGQQCLTEAAGAAWVPGGHLGAVFAFTVTGGRIVAIDVISDPERIRQLDVELLDA
nr:hypothetical protein [Jiangella asiatica]